MIFVTGLAAHGAVVITSGLAAPTTDLDDQFYLPGSVAESATMGTHANSGANDALTYVANDRTSKGMSFTTGSNAGGYTISSITVQHVLWPTFVTNGTFYGVANGNTFDFEIGTISGSNLTPILTTAATYSGAGISGAGTSGTGTYFTFDLSGEGLAALAPNTTYYFEIASGTGNPFFELNSTSADGYAGGQAFAGNNASILDTDNVVSLSSGDFAFHAGLTAIPEPSAALLGGLGILGLLRRRRA
jgi:hypothetical protein